jgi:hypothetical protein
MYEPPEGKQCVYPSGNEAFSKGADPSPQLTLMQRSNKSIWHVSLKSVGTSPYSQQDAPAASVEVPRLTNPNPASNSGQSIKQSHWIAPHEQYSHEPSS